MHALVHVHAHLRLWALPAGRCQNNYHKGHTERLPYNESSIRSMYHVRDFEVYRLM
jgi:lariat debranching enzyme